MRTTPSAPVKELIRNSLDADAIRVEVTIETSELGGLADGVTVIDDGTGIAPDGCVAAFERIGGSWKKKARRTLGRGRRLHGSSGQGRLRGYALGHQLRWRTTAAGPDGHYRTEITANSARRNDFEISDSVKVDDNPGTAFSASGKQSKRLDQLLTDDAFAAITVELAPYLTVYSDIEVLYNGRRVDPQISIAREVKYPLCL